jgi:DNA-binding protein YbaB
VAGPTGEPGFGFFPELRDLQRDAAVLAGKLAAAEAAAAEASGRDPSEHVRVVLAALGRIASVHVNPRWQTRIGPGELGAAVLAAYREAGSRRVETWAAEIGRAGVHPPSSTRYSMPIAGPATGPADDSSHESIRRLWYLLQDATDRLDDVVRAAAIRSRAVVTGRDPGGHVTASLSGGGELTDLTVDEAWATEAGDSDIGSALTSAITDGYAMVDQGARESTGQWPFPDLERVSGSPAALLATLGLPAVMPDDDRRGE